MALDPTATQRVLDGMSASDDDLYVAIAAHTIDPLGQLLALVAIARNLERLELTMRRPSPYERIGQ
jgi:hypothetical protein